MYPDIQQKKKKREKELKNVNMKKSDIILAGVGGQGILSIAAIIGEAALAENLYIKQAEVHGMSQRGGDVQSNLRLSDTPINSDLISLGGADYILSLEPMEALRYLPYLDREGWIITSSSPFVNIPNYPDADALKGELHKMKNVISIDVEGLAKEHNLPKSANVIPINSAIFTSDFANRSMGLPPFQESMARGEYVHTKHMGTTVFQWCPSVSKKYFRPAVRILKLSKSFKILLIERAVGFVPPAHTPRCSVPDIVCEVF